MRNRGRIKYYSKFFRLTVWLLIYTLLVPVSAMTAAANENPANEHILRRLNSPERAAALAEAARKDAAMQAAQASGGSANQPEFGASKELRGHDRNAEQTLTPAATGNRITDRVPAIRRDGTSASASRPKTVSEVLFNGVTGFMGLPGLTSSGYDPYNPNADQGLGFHADGTARRADGTTGDNAASSRFDGKRAAAYAGAGLGYGPGMGMGGYGYGNGFGGSGLYGGMHDDLWGRDDSTRGGRRADQSGYGLFDTSNPQNYFMQRGLNYGMGMVNSAAEGLFTGISPFGDSPYGGSRARLNFMIDWDGRFNGEGDVLLPWYDSRYTTVYTQIGARSMSGMNGGGSDGQGADRWIGNLGFGQRWFPAAVNDGIGQDAGNWMIGYNAFYDYDFTRSHQRGGVGIEAQYDWLRLATNYYFPLSSWRDSKDFDGDFVKERAAEGWDIRAKGYLPFYRNLAVTGAYSQWYGDHVGMFSSAKLEKDPRVWSYGLEYTPVPLVSGFVNQRSTERGRSDTEFGLRFTYHFQMPWEDQISHSKVAELRTVGGSRHEFVDRENRIILEYKAKNSYRIEYLGPDGNGFRFRVVDGFGKYMAGQQVRVTAGGTYLAEAVPAEPQTLFAQVVNFLDDLISVKAAYAAGFASRTYTTDGQGYFWVQLDPSAPSPATVTVQAGDNSQSFTLAGGSPASLYAYDLSLLAVTATGDLSGTIKVTNIADSSDASGVAVALSYATFGGSGPPTATNLALGNTGSNGEVSVSGNVTALARQIRFTANSDSASAVTKTVGMIPSGFLTGASVGASGNPADMSWSDAKNYCAAQGGRLPRVNNMNSYPSSSYAGNEPVDGFGVFGATWPSGLPSAHYWTGTEVTDLPGSSWIVIDGVFGIFAGGVPQSVDTRVVCVP